MQPTWNSRWEADKKEKRLIKKPQIGHEIRAMHEGDKLINYLLLLFVALYADFFLGSLLHILTNEKNDSKKADQLFITSKNITTRINLCRSLKYKTFFVWYSGVLVTHKYVQQVIHHSCIRVRFWRSSSVRIVFHFSVHFLKFHFIYSIPFCC